MLKNTILSLGIKTFKKTINLPNMVLIFNLLILLDIYMYLVFHHRLFSYPTSIHDAILLGNSLMFFVVFIFYFNWCWPELFLFLSITIPKILDRIHFYTFDEAYQEIKRLQENPNFIEARKLKAYIDSHENSLASKKYNTWKSEQDDCENFVQWSSSLIFLFAIDSWLTKNSLFQIIIANLHLGILGKIIFWIPIISFICFMLQAIFGYICNGEARNYIYKPWGDQISRSSKPDPE